MIIANCGNFLQGALSIRDIFIKLANNELISLMYNKSDSLNKLLDLYTLEDIKRAINSINIVDNYLSVPEQTVSSKILRYLEYGGENIRPIHFLTKVKTKLYKIYSMRGDEVDVF